MADRKDTVCLDPKVLRKPTVLSYAVGPQIQAEKKIAAHAVKAFATCFVAISNDPLTLLEILYR